MFKQFLRAAAATVAAVLFLSCPCLAAPELSAQRAILTDADSGRVLYEKQANEQALIASTTKIMTALLVCERCSMTDEVKIPREAVGIEGSSMYLQEGESLSVQELLYGLMLRSGNDAAVALAICCAGSEERFVSLMNERADSLGLQNTHYGNPHGLDSEDNYSTAADLAALAAFAMDNKTFYETVSTKTAVAGGRQLQNHNKLLFRYDGAVGVKTGYTKAAGRILVSAAERDGRRLIAVTLHAPDDWNDHAKLLDYGFSQFKRTVLVEENAHMADLPVAGGTDGSVGVAAAEEFSYPLAESEHYTVELLLPKLLFAPVGAGQEVGTAVIRLGEKEIGRIPLCLEEPVYAVQG